MIQISPKKKEELKKYLKVKEHPGEYEEHLWKKVEKYLPYFSYIPGLQCICVCNSLAMNACHQNSDIDLFVITRKNRLWTTRIFLTLVTSILGLRKTSKKHAGQFCLSFFVTEDIKDFGEIAIKNDIYLSYWVQTLSPVINKNNTFERFFERNNLKEDFSLHQTPLSNSLLLGERTSHRYTCSFISPMGQNCERSESREHGKKGVTKIFGDLIEGLLKKVFLPKTLRSYEKLGKPFGVVISDKMLKFHDTDKRKEIRDNLM